MVLVNVVLCSVFFSAQLNVHGINQFDISSLLTLN